MGNVLRGIFKIFGSPLGRKFIVAVIGCLLLVVSVLIAVLVGQNRDTAQLLTRTMSEALNAESASTAEVLNSFGEVSAENLKMALQDKGNSLARLMSEIGVNPLLGRDTDILEAYVKSVKQDRDVAYAVYEDSQAKVMTQGAPMPQDTSTMINISLPVKIEGQTLGRVKLGISKRSVERQTDMVRSTTGNTIEMKQAAMSDTIHKTESLSSATSQRSIRIVVGLSIVSGLVLVVVMSVIFTLTTLRPLGQITQMMQRISAGEGDLTQRLEVSSRDEMSVLAMAFNDFMVSMQNIVRTIISTSDRVLATAEELSSSAQQMNASTEEVSASIQQISRGISDQATRTERTAQIMKDMSDSAQHVVAGAQQGATSSQDTSSLAQQGMELSRKAVDKTTQMTQVSTQIGTMMGKLGERSQEIGRIVEVITTIADQTNLLALNAAIEAARAGDAGRGFAVVADEVRKLAESSAKAAEQISTLIRNIQQETSQTVESVNQSTREVEEGKVVIQEVYSFLEKILVSAHTAVTIANDIAQKSNVQSRGAQEAQSAVSQVAEIAERSAAATEESASSVEEMTASMQQMAAGAQELSHQAAELKKLVDKFKV